jgi:hypothetical protein
MPFLSLVLLLDDFKAETFTFSISLKKGKVIKIDSKVRKLTNQLLAVIYDNSLTPERLKVKYFEFVGNNKYVKIQTEEI